MSVVYELKQKRAALIDRLQQLERERVDIQELMRALERVILSYEPDFQASSQPGSGAVIDLLRQSRRRPW